MIVDHMPLVNRILKFMRLPNCGDHEDLRAAGMEALVRAANKFDSSREPKFSTYAAACIRGAILNELKRLDRLTPSLRKAMGKNPDGIFHDRVAATLGLTPATLRERLAPAQSLADANPEQLAEIKEATPKKKPSRTDGDLHRKEFTVPPCFLLPQIAAKTALREINRILNNWKWDQWRWEEIQQGRIYER